MPEELGLEQRLGERRAIELDERLLPARGQVVQAGGDQLLARAALADDEHRLAERAARETCSIIARKAGASPISGGRDVVVVGM